MARKVCMTENNNLSESLEDYLEAILELEETSKVARAKDIADKIGVQRGSVTAALKVLEEKALINYQPYSFITLTDKGRAIAAEISNRHAILKDFLLRVLQFDEESAELTACRMEHAVDEKAMQRFVRFIGFIDSCPRAGRDLIEKFTGECSVKSPEIKRCKNCCLSVAETVGKKA
jgi:DtxR family transcriptional regulator, Mn-dependent transcriptional regulator